MKIRLSGRFIRFSGAFLIAHLAAFAALYALFSIREDGWNVKFLLLTAVALVLWSVGPGFLHERHALLRHLPVLLLPYLYAGTEMMNFGFQPKTYFCSQLYYLFSYGTVLLAADILLVDVPKKTGVVRVTAAVIRYGSLFVFYLVPPILALQLLIHGIGIDRNAVVAICQTDPHEATAYFFNVSHGVLVLAALAVWTIGFTVWAVYDFRRLKRMTTPGRGTFAAFAVALLLFTPLFMKTVRVAGRGKIFTLNSELLLRTPFLFRREIAEYNRLHAERMREVRAILARETPPQERPTGRFVLIIGESVNRHYMSCYGHRPDTTPFQRELVRDSGTFLFSDAYACFAQTVRVFAMLLTDANQYNGRLSMKGAVSIIDLAKFNGFRCSWHSNQAALSAADSPIIALAAASDEMFFLSSQRRKLKRRLFDLELIPFLPEFATDRELVIVHLAGSHIPYKNCIPDNFMPEAEFSTYERSLRYNDEVVAAIFRHFSVRGADAIVYISDHSDAVSSGRGHDPRPGVFTQEMVEIPLWVHLSPELRKRRPELAEQLSVAKARVFTNDLLFDLMAALMGIKNRFTPDKYNVLSPDYSITRDNARTGYGRIKLNFEKHSPSSPAELNRITP